MKIAVIGAGVNGLFVTRELLCRKHDVTVYDSCLYGAQKRASSGSRAITVLYQKPGINLEIMQEGYDAWLEIMSKGYLGSPGYNAKSQAEIFAEIDLVEIFANSNLEAAKKLKNEICSSSHKSSNFADFLEGANFRDDYDLPGFRDDNALYLFRPKSMILVDAKSYLETEWKLIESRINSVIGYANSISANSVDGENFDQIFICTGAWASSLLPGWGSVDISKFISSQLYIPFSMHCNSILHNQNLPAIRDYRSGSYFLYPGMKGIDPKVMKNNYGPAGEINIDRVDHQESEEVKAWLTKNILGSDVSFSSTQTCHYLVNPDGLPIVGENNLIKGTHFVLEAPGSGFRTAPILAKYAVQAALGEKSLDSKISPNRFS